MPVILWGHRFEIPKESLLIEQFWGKGTRVYFAELCAFEMLLQRERHGAVEDCLARTPFGMNGWAVFWDLRWIEDVSGDARYNDRSRIPW